jgi:chorismate mutase
MTMYVRGIRGAITVEENSAEQILSATRELLDAMIARNQLDARNVASVFITTTVDLNAAFPALAVRNIEGWDKVPLLCSTEIPVPGSLPYCIRVLIHCNTSKEQEEMEHVYLRGAAALRPDIVTPTKP